jgi:uncharacterized protein YbjT (DUF2867 family)
MNRALVIGGTGTVGRQVVAQLLTGGVQIRVLTRNPAAAGLPGQVAVVRGDLTLPETLDSGLGGVEAVFLVWTAPPATISAALERITKCVRRIVFLSAPIETPHPLFQQPNPVRAMAEQIERLIEASGVEWTFLRPGMFAANSLSWWAPQIRDGGVVRWPCLSVPTAPIDERDIARVAVRALCEEGHDRAEYVLTGPESLTQREQLSIIGRTIGREVLVEELSPDQARQELLTTFPAAALNMLIDAWTAAAGQPALVTSTFAALMGVRPRTFLEWATDHSAEFRASRTASHQEP